MSSIVVTSPSEGAGSGGGAITTPHVVYIETTGDDATGVIGDRSKPFATGTAAFIAAVAVAQPFAMRFGVGAFSIIRNDWSSHCKALIGEAAGPTEALSLTYVNVQAAFLGTENPRLNGFGLSAPSMGEITLCNLFLKAYLVGQDVVAEDGGSYEAGSGGSLSAFCSGATLELDFNGGSGGGSNGTVNAGYDGGLNLRGDWRLVRAVAASMYLDGGDLRGAYLSNYITMDLGRCSHDYALTPTNNLGGNAAY